MEFDTIKKKSKYNNNIVLAFFSLALIFVIVLSIFLSGAYFTAQQTGNSIISTGTIKVAGCVVEGGVEQNGPIQFDGPLMAGATTTKTVRFKNDNAQSMFIRIYCKFSMDLNDNGTYTEKDFVTMSFVDQTGWTRFTTADANNTSSSNNPDNKYYYATAIANSGHVDVDLVFTVSNTFGNSNQDGTEEYTNKGYKIQVFVEAIQSVGTSVGNAGGWYEAGTSNLITEIA